MTQNDESKILKYDSPLKVVHMQPLEAKEPKEEKDEKIQVKKYGHWKMPVERPGYIKSKKHDCL